MSLVGCDVESDTAKVDESYEPRQRGEPRFRFAQNDPAELVRDLLKYAQITRSEQVLHMQRAWNAYVRFIHGTFWKDTQINYPYLKVIDDASDLAKLEYRLLNNASASNAPSPRVTDTPSFDGDECEIAIELSVLDLPLEKPKKGKRIKYQRQIPLSDWLSYVKGELKPKHWVLRLRLVREEGVWRFAIPHHIINSLLVSSFL